MKIMKEVTDWSKAQHAVPNHTYAVSPAGKLLAFKRSGESEIRLLSGKARFDKSRRKFITLTKGPVFDSFQEVLNG